MIPEDLFDALCAAAEEATVIAWQFAHSRTATPPDEVAHMYELTMTGISRRPVRLDPEPQGKQPEGERRVLAQDREGDMSSTHIAA